MKRLLKSLDWPKLVSLFIAVVLALIIAYLLGW